MTKEELAATLNGRTYGEEITRAEAAAAKAAGLVVVYGASDDLMVFDGAINDEFGAFGGAEIYITPHGVLEYCEENCGHYKRAKKSAVLIQALWEEVDGYAWAYETDIPHATFDIVDGEQDGVFCRGIVFALADVGKKQ